MTPLEITCRARGPGGTDLDKVTLATVRLTYAGHAQVYCHFECATREIAERLAKIWANSPPLYLIPLDTPTAAPLVRATQLSILPGFELILQNIDSILDKLGVRDPWVWQFATASGSKFPVTISGKRDQLVVPWADEPDLEVLKAELRRLGITPQHGVTFEKEEGKPPAVYVVLTHHCQQTWWYYIEVVGGIVARFK